MTNFLLIRHGHTDALGKSLPGRMPGVRLSRRGENEVQKLADRLSSTPLHAIYSSPLERTVETAEIIAERRGLTVAISHALNEVDCGAWTGLAFQTLEETPEWKTFNENRSGARIPGGERLIDVQYRVIDQLDELRRKFPDGNVGVVTHGDVIRAAVCHHVGIPIDLALRIVISPASVSILSLHGWGARMQCINHTEEVPLP